MRFSYNWLKEFINVRETPEKLAEFLTLHSFEARVFKKERRDIILDIDVLPNRAHDVQSHLGLAKEIAVLIGRKTKVLAADFKENSNKKTSDLVRVVIKDTSAALRYQARVIESTVMASTPAWIKEKLEAFSIKPHNLVVDILNYVMLEIGQPLHAFDYDKLAGLGKTKEIIVRFAKNGEQIKTLDGSNFNLDKKVLVIADSRKPIAIAGIKGGFDTGVDSGTKIIVIESANFDSQIIRQGSKLLNLATDASMRFSQGLDPNLVEFGINRALHLIQKFGKGKILKGRADIYPKKSLPRTIKFSTEKLNQLIGLSLSVSEVVAFLKRQNFEVKKAGGPTLLVKVPTERLDLEIQEDLIEEIARLYGYQNLKSALPYAPIQFPALSDLEIVSRKARNFLVSQDFSEAYNYSFNSIHDLADFSLDKEKVAELENPVSDEFCFLRPSLSLNLIKDVAKNFRFFDALRLFEIGKVFQKANTIQEIRLLSGVLAIKTLEEKSAGSLFFEAKGLIDGLFESLGVADYFYDDTDSQSKFSPQLLWYEARLAEIKVDSKSLGFVGEVRPQVLSRLGIKGRVVVFDLDLSELAKTAEIEKEYQGIPKYPSVVRDLAVLIDRGIRVSEVLNVIYGAGVKLIDDVDLFDYYEGEELPEDKKSLAFHIVFQGNRTLTDAEVDAEENKIKKALIEKLNAEIR